MFFLVIVFLMVPNAFQFARYVAITSCYDTFLILFIVKFRNNSTYLLNKFFNWIFKIYKYKHVPTTLIHTSSFCLFVLFEHRIGK